MFVLLVGGSPGSAQDVDPVELARQALDDSSAREELRRLTPAADRALTGASGDVAERLEVLAGQVGYQSVDDPREIAQDILTQPRFGNARDNTAGAFWEDLMRRLSLWFNRLLSIIIGNVPGGTTLFYGILLLLLAVGGGFLASRLAQDRIRTAEAASIARLRRERGLSPAELRRRARDAAAAGDHEEAIRLLFLAGLTTLDERDRIEFSPGTTTAEISDELGSDTFDHLVDRFNEVVYGSRAAGSVDFEESQAEWETVLEQA